MVPRGGGGTRGRRKAPQQDGDRGRDTISFRFSGHGVSGLFSSGLFRSGIARSGIQRVGGLAPRAGLRTPCRRDTRRPLRRAADL